MSELEMIVTELAGMCHGGLTEEEAMRLARFTHNDRTAAHAMKVANLRRREQELRKVLAPRQGITQEPLQ